MALVPSPWSRPAASDRVAVASLLVANAVPLLGVLFGGWNVWAILVLYWVESGVVGLLNVPRILLAAGQGSTSMTATVNGRQVDLSPPDPDDVVDDPRIYPSNVPIAAFFCMHYGIFWVVHGVFVLFGLPAFAGQAGGFDAVPVALAAVAMLVSHAGSFRWNYLGKREYLRVSPGQRMADPYRRVFVLHLTIVLGGFVVASLGSPVYLLVLMVVLKTGIDLAAHLREHRRATGEAPPTSASA